jgi:hypothetical protein
MQGALSTEAREYVCRILGEGWCLFATSGREGDSSESIARPLYRTLRLSEPTTRAICHRMCIVLNTARIRASLPVSASVRVCVYEKFAWAEGQKAGRASSTGSVSGRNFS